MSIRPLTRRAVLLAVAAAAVCAVWRSKTPLPVADEFTAEQAKALIPEAAGIPWDEFRKYDESGWFRGDARPPNGEPLTWVFFLLWVEPELRVNPAPYFPHGTIIPIAMASRMAKPPDGTYRPYESLIHPEYITDCTCEVNGDTATGTVSFKVENVYQGKVEYAARKKDGTWRIEEFRIPDLKVTTVLGDDGKWVKK